MSCPPSSKHALPQWPQKANHLKKIRGVRRRIQRELALVNELAAVQSVPTRGRSVLAVLQDLEMLAEELPSTSPTFADYEQIRNTNR